MVDDDDDDDEHDEELPLTIMLKKYTPNISLPVPYDF